MVPKDSVYILVSKYHKKVMTIAKNYELTQIKSIKLNAHVQEEITMMNAVIKYYLISIMRWHFISVHGKVLE